MLLTLGCAPNPAFGQFDSDDAVTAGADTGPLQTSGRPTGGSTSAPQSTSRDGSGVTSVDASTGPQIDTGTDADDTAGETSETVDVVDVAGEPCAFLGEPPEGLIACWNFDDFEGSTALDEVGGLALDFAAPPIPNTGLFAGTSVELDGIAASATFPAPPNMPSTRFTLEAWMQVQDGWGDNAVSMVLRPDGPGASLGGIGMSINTTGDDSVVFTHTSSTIALPAPGGDYLACVAVSFDGQDATGYSRSPSGMLDVVPLRGAAPLTTGEALLLFVQSEAQGLLDGVRIWDYAVGQDAVCTPTPP